ncbi:MAG: alpha-amylase family glycosyl hydrolase, partial [Bacteroidota bacterium]
DFTDRLPVSDDLKGTIPAMTMPGLTNSRGEPIGFDYLKDLGVNVVHLMPMQEFLHYPDDVWQAAFADDPFMQAQGVADENYQWGYRITHYMAVESRFRQRGTEPGAEREQFRDLVQAFHDEGMAVIVDFVFNHTGENMEGTQQVLNFNGIDKLYYYRILPDLFGTFDHIGVFGNEVKSEDRPMVQRWLIDQCLHFIEEFGVDGFRIDLAGQTDEQTLRAVREAIGRDKIVYGEPWIGSNDPAFEANPDWDWYKVDSPITFFQDDARNAFKGPTSDPTPAVESRGFAGGDGAVREQTMRALSNQFPDEATPNMGINYLDIHDNWALPDRYARNKTGADAWDGRAGVDEDRYRIAATLLFTSLGPIVLNGGSEMLRSKGAAPLQSEMGGQKVLETS